MCLTLIMGPAVKCSYKYEINGRCGYSSISRNIMACLEVMKMEEYEPNIKRKEKERDGKGISWLV